MNNIKWRPDEKSNVPIYRQIVQFICEQVANGTWPVGTKLPSQRSLASQFQVNRSTIVSALDELMSYGVISSNHGAGTLVASNTWSLLLPSDNDWKKFINNGFFKENRKMIQAINRLEPDPNLTRLGTGELDPRLFPKDMWQEVLQKMSQKITSLGYVEPLGLLELRQSISKHMKTLGIKAKPENILITSGALQALQLISVSLLNDQTTVYTEAPTYLQSLQMFQSAGMNLTGMPMDKSGLQYWKIGQSLKENSAIIYTIPTNQNPTGITMPLLRRKELLNFCLENRLPIIEDGAYQELCFDESVMPLKALDKNGSVMYLGSSSKTLAPGLRIGWVVADEPIIKRLGDVKMQMDYGASSLSQWAFTEFLNSGLYYEYVKQLKQKLKQRRDNALKVLENNFKDIATWQVPEGGFYIWLTFKNNVQVDQLFEKSVQHKILLNPGDMYDFKHNRSLRLSYAYVNQTEFEQNILTLRKII